MPRPERGSAAGGAPSASRTERQSLYEQLRDSIVSGTFHPGQQLVEASLAEMFQVSRTPIREALNRLEQDGVVVRRDRGLAVRESSQDEILDLYETRIVVEAKAAQMAAERRTSHDVVRMRHLSARMRDFSADTDVSTVANVNRQFHRAVWKASHNESLIDLLERLNLHLQRYPETTLSHPGRREKAVEEHDQLINAIEARDTVQAAEIATKHFTAARDIRLSLWTETDAS